LVKFILGDAKPLTINGIINFLAIMDIVDESLNKTNLSHFKMICHSESGSRKAKFSTDTSVRLRILEMSSIPPSLKAAVMFLLSRMTSVTWTKQLLKLGEGWELGRHGWW
jgi:hypothetical protein